MGFSSHWSWLAALSYLLCMGWEVRCDCTEANMQIEGGDYKLTKRLQTGSLLIYNCPEGYYPFPALTRLCQPSGSWRPAPRRSAPQRCRIVECPDPNVLEYGNVSPPQERYFVDNETTYECYSGYTMRGSSRRVCLPNGKWSGSTPICSRDSGDNCADPGVPAGASRTGNMFGIDDTVRYSCNGNLFLVGSSERVCQENGQWTGKEPACYSKHTYDTALEVSEAFGSTIKGALTALELNDDMQEGRKIKISRTGTLDIYIAVDISESIQEQHISDAKKAITKLITKISSFAVTPNYEVLFFSCEIFEVVSILDFWGGQISLSTIKTELEKFQVGDKKTRGTDLNLVFKTFLERMAIIKQRTGEEAFKEHRHILIVFTDGAYTVGGSPVPTVTKIKNMVYMSHTDEGETPLREEYLDIYIFAIGHEIFDDDLQPLTAGVGGHGQHYFRMKNIENLPETLSEIIDEEEVKGLCGLHQEYETHDDRRKMYPWVAFIFISHLGGLRKCIGSLVSPRFVLTAAHCFVFGDLSQDITVEIDDGQGKVKRVKDFNIHPNYNATAAERGVLEFYDYDVALVQLEQDVQISSVARPICIPCTQETSAALKLVGESCKQQEQLLLRNHLERLTFLTRIDQRVRAKHVHAKLGDNRDECIRHALQATGITTNNPKDAVTDNFLCTGGQTPFRDDIVCPGDGGSAVFKNYEHRAVQVALVSWGTSKLCGRSGNIDPGHTSRDLHMNLFRVVPFLKSILGNDYQLDYEPLQFLEN